MLADPTVSLLEFIPTSAIEIYGRHERLRHLARCLIMVTKKYVERVATFIKKKKKKHVLLLNSRREIIIAVLESNAFKQFTTRAK